MEKRNKNSLEEDKTSSAKKKLTTAQKNKFIKELSKKVNRKAHLRMMQDLIKKRKEV